MTDRLDKPMAYGANAQTIDDTQNRGLDIKRDAEEQSPIVVTLMTIDEILVNYLNDTIKPSVVDNDSVRMVPVLYGTPERWATFRKDGVIRDGDSDKAVTPLILIRRTSMDRGKLTNPSNKYIQTAWETGWNKRNAYDKFSVLNGVTPSREFHAVIVPDYVDLHYEVIVWTEYEEQMSDVLGQLQVENDEFWGTRNGFKFRVRIDKFDSQSQLESTQDRIVRTQFSMKVGAYLIPERMVKNFKITPTTSKMYTSKKAIIMVEVDGTKT
jgi:hypothetical protein